MQVEKLAGPIKWVLKVLKNYWSTRKIKRHFYWVSYAFQTTNVSGFGATDMRMYPRKITNGSDVQLITDWIKKNCFPGQDDIRVVVNSWTFLRSERC